MGVQETAARGILAAGHWRVLRRLTGDATKGERKTAMLPSILSPYGCR